MGLFSFLFSLGSPEAIGRSGENKIAKKLRRANFYGFPGRILRNLYIPRTDGSTTEADLVYVTEKGLFVIESKNYSGYIFGNQHSHTWTASLPSGRARSVKYRFYNPILQNSAHIRALRQYLGQDIPCISLVVFSAGCRLMDVSWSSPAAYICLQNELLDLLRQLWEQYPSILSEEDISDIHQRLLPLTEVDAQQKQQHIEHIISREHERSMLCPRCGGQLVLRTAKASGNQFYGCSRFPACRYTRNL